jgi:hypothetical protein
MAFVVEAAYADEVQQSRKLLQGVDEPLKRQFAYLDAAREMMSRPAGVAVLEILQGSRSDADLADKLKPIVARIEVDSFNTLGQELGRAPSRSLVGLVVWAMRGLSVAKVLASENWAPEESVAMLRFLIGAAVQNGSLQDGIPRRRGAAENKIDDLPSPRPSGCC